MRAKRFSAFCPSTIQRFSAVFRCHFCTKSLGALAHDVRARGNVFFHGLGLLLDYALLIFINFFIITQMKPKSTLKVINEIEIVTHNSRLSSAALKYIRFFIDCLANSCIMMLLSIENAAYLTKKVFHKVIQSVNNLWI